MAEQSLKDKTVKGVGWSAADSILGHGVTFLVGLVLARLLTPSEYGLIGIVLIFTSVLGGFVDSGFSAALIRKKGATDVDYNTMFITNMVMSVLMCVLLYVFAPTIAHFFERNELVDLVRVMGLMLIFQALSITQVTILTKRLDFKSKTYASLSAAVLSGVVGIAMAFCGFGVWALVGQKLSHSLCYSISLWIVNKWWPKGTFSRKSFAYMWDFGWKMMVSGILNNIWEQLYQVIVGKFYSPSTLGQYTRAREYATIFSANFTSIIQRVTFPVLSEVQDDTTRMVVAYRRIIKVTMFVTCICLIALGAVSEPFIYCLIGPQWHEAAMYLPLICISLSLYPMHAINLNMLKVLGRSDIFLGIEILKKIIGIGPVCLGIFINIYWMLIGTIIAGIISVFINSYYTGKHLGYNTFMQIRDVAPSYLIAFIVALSVYFIKYLQFNNYFILTLQIVVGIIVFLFICKVFKVEEYSELKGLLKPFLNKRKRK